jgi:4-hydroxy-3-methylbut-2-enyl diphosphate reductase
MLYILLAKPRGFCAGVKRAIDIAESALKHFPHPIYIKHEIVHNKRIVQDLIEKGIIFVESVDDIPDNSTVIFSAHGSPKNHYEKLEQRNIRLIDATCPLVSKVHKMGNSYHEQGKEIIMIGHKKHVETIGTIGNIEQAIQVVESVECVENLVVKNPDNLSFITQTTLSLDDTSDIIAALRKKFPNIYGGEGGTGNTCYATQNRQDAVKKMIQSGIKLLIVIGSQSSSNSNRLAEIGTKNNIPSYLIDGKQDIKLEWLTNITKIGITAGASAHETFVQEVIEYLSHNFETQTDEIEGEDENVVFFAPKIIRDLDKL